MHSWLGHFHCGLFSVYTVIFSVHSKRSCPTTSTQKFAEEICKAMVDLKDLFGAWDKKHFSFPSPRRNTSSFSLHLIYKTFTLFFSFVNTDKCNQFQLLFAIQFNLQWRTSHLCCWRHNTLLYITSVFLYIWQVLENWQSLELLYSQAFPASSVSSLAVWKNRAYCAWWKLELGNEARNWTLNPCNGCASIFDSHAAITMQQFLFFYLFFFAFFDPVRRE